MAKPYVYKGWLGGWFVLFPNNERPKFDTWRQAINTVLGGK